MPEHADRQVPGVRWEFAAAIEQAAQSELGVPQVERLEPSLQSALALPQAQALRLARAVLQALDAL